MGKNETAVSIKAEDITAFGAILRERRVKAKLTAPVQFYDRGKLRTIPKGTVLPIVWHEEVQD